MCSPLDLLTVPQPHFIPGYTGYCPQYIYRCGNTYGVCTHKVLVDPSINHAEDLVLSDRTADEYPTYRPARREIDIVKARTKLGDPIYQHPMVSGYEGFIPRMTDHFAQSFSVSATEAISEFEQQQFKTRGALHRMRKLGAAQDDSFDPKNLEDKTDVRPEQVGVLRDRKVVEPVLEPPVESRSPYFMSNDNSDKQIMKGAGVSIPFGYAKFGMRNDPMTNSALCDFTSNYRRRLSTEWAPVNIVRPDPPLHIQPMDIYNKHVGLIPNYMGHVPGVVFRCGKTFGDDTRDAKRWLRGDYRMMALQALDDCFRRKQAMKMRFPGHIRYGYTFGQGLRDPRTNSSTAEFEKSYKLRPSSEWSPSDREKIEPPREIQCYGIYHIHVGHIPNYAGHIPGARFRCGKTFGADTTNAKRWLKGDFRPN